MSNTRKKKLGPRRRLSAPPAHWAHDRILRSKWKVSAPSPPEARRRRGLGRGGRLFALFMGFPLSLTLSPFVPHGERGLAQRKRIWAARYSCLKKPMKRNSRRILSCAPAHFRSCNDLGRRWNVDRSSSKGVFDESFRNRILRDHQCIWLGYRWCAWLPDVNCLRVELDGENE